METESILNLKKIFTLAISNNSIFTIISSKKCYHFSFVLIVIPLEKI